MNGGEGLLDGKMEVDSLCSRCIQLVNAAISMV